MRTNLILIILTILFLNFKLEAELNIAEDKEKIENFFNRFIHELATYQSSPGDFRNNMTENYLFRRRNRERTFSYY